MSVAFAAVGSPTKTRCGIRHASVANAIAFWLLMATTTVGIVDSRRGGIPVQATDDVRSKAKQITFASRQKMAFTITSAVRF